MLGVATEEDRTRIELMTQRVYNLFLEEPEKQTIFVATLLNLLASQLMEECPNDSSVQDSKMEDFNDIIKLTLIHNKVRKAQ